VQPGREAAVGRGILVQHARAQKLRAEVGILPGRSVLRHPGHDDDRAVPTHPEERTLLLDLDGDPRVDLDRSAVLVRQHVVVPHVRTGPPKDPDDAPRERAARRGIGIEDVARIDPPRHEPRLHEAAAREAL
jgi:hypothetical protein